MSDKPGIIYIVENLAWPCWFKVGRAEGKKEDAEGTMKRRLYQYNTGDPSRSYTVLIHDYASCCHAAETYAHSMLALNFERGRGEWFRGSPRLAEEIVRKACHIARLAPNRRPERFSRLIEEMRRDVSDDTQKILQEIADIETKKQPQVAVTARAAGAVIRDLLEMMAMPCENTEAAAKAVLRRLDVLGEES